MIADGRNFIQDGWWISLFPGLAIVLVGVTFTFLGDGLDDFLRPKA
jgi:peptide/nickel transport system permease protein